MIVSASRRTDIPAFYMDWFLYRLKEGAFYVANPFNNKQVYLVAVKDIDCFVFWTKNPLPFLEKIEEMKDYNYYFQFTLNSYGRDIEPDVPSKNDIIINAFIKLSQKIGRDRVIWRYDPIILTKKYTIEYHLKYFEKIAERIHDYTTKCIISFIDIYDKIKKNLQDIEMMTITKEERERVIQGLTAIAKKYDLVIETCSEDIDINKYDIKKSKCIDDSLISKIIGKQYPYIKDKYQRKECNCLSSIDIGVYNTCLHKCKYCYANSENIKINHDFHSKLLTGDILDDSKISIKK